MKRTKKVVKILIFTSVLLSVAVIPCHTKAAVDNKGIMSVTPMYEDGPDGRVSISVKAKDIERLYGGELDLQFDTNFGSVIKVEEGKILDEAISAIDKKRIDDGIIEVDWYSFNELEDSGTILNVVFQLNPDQETRASDLLLLNAGVYNEYAETIHIDKKNGFVKPFNGKVMETKAVPQNKQWIVTFNTEINLESIQNQNIYIKNESEGSIHPTTVTISDNGLEATIIPKKDYDKTEEYSLYVSENVSSAYDKKLVKAVKQPFKVK